MLQDGDFQLELQLQRNTQPSERTSSSQEEPPREVWRGGKLHLIGPDLDGVHASLKLVFTHLPSTTDLPSEVEIYINEQKNASNPLLWPGTHLSMDGLTFAAMGNLDSNTLDIEVRFYRVIELRQAQTADGQQVLYETKRMVDPQVIMRAAYSATTPDSADVTGSTSDPASSQSPSSAAFIASQLTPSPAFPQSAPDSVSSAYPHSSSQLSSQSQSLSSMTPPTPLTIAPSAYLPSSSAADFSIGSIPDILSTPPPSSTPSTESEAPMDLVPNGDRKRKRPEDESPLAGSPDASHMERRRRQADGETFALDVGFTQSDSPLLSLSTPLLVFLLSHLDHSSGYLDLLSLSRCCKQLYRFILSSPASSLIWSSLHSFDFSSVGKNATKTHIADIIYRCKGYSEDSHPQTRELLNSSKLLQSIEQRGRVRSLNLSYCARLSLVDIKRLVEMCAPPKRATVREEMDHHTPPKQEGEDEAIAAEHLETLRLMDLDAIRNVAFIHGLYSKSAPYLRILEVKNCSGLDNSRAVPFFDATSPRPSPCPSPAPSPMPGAGRVSSVGRTRGTPSSMPYSGRGTRASVSTPTFVVTPSRQHGPATHATQPGRGRGPSPSSRALFSTPPHGYQPSSGGLLGLPADGHHLSSISAPSSPYATPPRQAAASNLLSPLREGHRARSAPTSPRHSPDGSPVGSPGAYGALAQLPHSLNLRELSLLKCAPPEHCVIQLVSALPNLESIDLWGCKITDKTIEVLAMHCPKMQKLCLAENPITDRALTAINPSSFPDLISLNLRRCTELSSAAIATMVSAWQSTLHHGEDDDYFKQETYEGEHAEDLPLPNIRNDQKSQAAPKHMESLDLWGVPIYDHALMAIVASFPHLKSLWLGETFITDEGLSALAQGCTELQELSLRRCSNGVTDAGVIPVLQSNPSLHKIDLWGVRRMSDAVIEVIAQRIPNVKSLELAESVITDAGLGLLAQHCHMIEELSLRRCLSISDAGVSAIAKGCPAIQILDLWESGTGTITDVGLEAIALHLHDLHSLEITEASITARSLVALASHCNRLTHLALRRCHLIDDAAMTAFFDALPAELRRKRIRTLDISYCPLITPATLEMLASRSAQLPHTIELYDCPRIGKPDIERFLASIPAGRTEVEYHDYKRLTIRQVKSLCDSFECSASCPTEYMRLVCTVNEIRTSSMWYPGCPWPKCNKKVEDHGSEEDEHGHARRRWFCKSCNRVYAQHVNRYMVSMRIVDHTGDLWLRAFDEAAAPLLGISAQELSQLKDLDVTLFEDKVKEAQLQQYELRLKVVHETFQGRRSGRPYLLSHSPISEAASSASSALAKRIDAYLMLDFLSACADM